MKHIDEIIERLTDYKDKLEKENRVLSYWENEFEKNPQEYVKDILQKRFVSINERKIQHRLLDDKNFIYSQGSFDRIIRWRDIPLYKNCYDYALYNNILTEIKPKTIFELGTGDGASSIWYRDMLNAHSLECVIKTYDLYKPIRTFETITYHQCDLNNLDDVKLDDLPHPWLVIEDCHVNLNGILKHFDNSMISGDYFVIEDMSAKKEKVVTEFLEDEKYLIDTRYTDFFGFNNCSFADGVFKKI
tara:strand:- start:1171 stop:1905 length:735 start_codon:yes stop_codon:yes gene_type:complete